MLRLADQEFKSRRYTQAASLYAQALESLRQTRAQGHTDIAYCLQNLSDSYALAGDYQSAYQVFLELFEVRNNNPGVNNIDLIATKYKMAKMLELGGMTEQALSGYAAAMAIAEQSLYEGHPVRAVIYVSYLELLQKTGSGNVQLLSSLNRKVQSAGGDIQLGAIMLDAMHLREFIGMVRAETTPAEQPSLLDQEISTGEAPPAKVPVKLIAIVAGIILLAGIGGAALFISSKQASEKKVEKAKVSWLNKSFDGQTFESASGQDKLIFLSGGKVETVLDGVKRDLPATVLPPDSELISAAGRSVRLFKRVPDGMLADNARMLYAEGAPQRAIIQRVKNIALAAEKYYQEHKEYPKTAKDITDIDASVAENPVSKTQEDPLFFDAGKERDWDQRKTPVIADDLEAGHPMTGESQKAPGSVHCYTFYTGDKYVEGIKCVAFFMRPVGLDGRWLPGAAAGSAYCVTMVAGCQPNVAGISTPRDPVEGDAQVTGIKVIADK